MRRTVLILSLATLLAAPLNGRENDIVKYRQAMMKAMGTYVSAIGAISKGTVPFRSELAANASSLHNLARALPTWFPAATSPDRIRSEALATVWKQPAQFSAAAKKLESETARLEQLAARGDVTAVATQLDSVKKSCGSCHETFRQKEDE